MLANLITHDAQAYVVRVVDKEAGIAAELSHSFIGEEPNLQLVVYHDIENGVGTPWPSQNTLNVAALGLVVRVFDDFLGCWPHAQMPTDLVRGFMLRRKGYAALYRSV